jgi:hypothetical protein
MDEVRLVLLMEHLSWSIERRDKKYRFIGQLKDVICLIAVVSYFGFVTIHINNTYESGGNLLALGLLITFTELALTWQVVDRSNSVLTKKMNHKDYQAYIYAIVITRVLGRFALLPIVILTKAFSLHTGL